MRLILVVAVLALLAAVVIVPARQPDPDSLYAGCEYVNRQPVTFFMKTHPEQVMCFGEVFCWRHRLEGDPLHAETICEATPEGGCPSAFDCSIGDSGIEYGDPANLAEIEVYSWDDER